jgi:hypothetical protein
MDAHTQSKLARLLGMLGSDYEGEILNAVSAIKQLLEAKGLTFGDVVATVSKPPALRRHHDDDYDDYQQPEYDAKEVVVMAKKLLLYEEDLKPHELKFVKQMKTRAMLGILMTEKQTKWFAFLVGHYSD